MMIIKTIQTLSPWPRLCPSCHAFTLLPDRLSLFRQLTCATNCTLRFALGQQQTQCFFRRPSAPLRLPTADGPNLLPSMSHVRRVQTMKPHSDCLGARANSDAFLPQLSSTATTFRIRIAHGRYETQFHHCSTAASVFALCNLTISPHWRV